jgi:tartrate-resistant acid phosphatase type 5
MKFYVLLAYALGSFGATAQTSKADSLPPLSLKFIAMGDWGRNGADHQKEVAAQMGKTAAALKTQFIISTGDNFYPAGVASEYDPLWWFSFENIYTDFSLQWDWYPVLGNHDYMSNPEAQVKYSSISRRWQMPARYYSKKFSIPGDTANKVLIVFIDTNPFIQKFYSNAQYGPNVKTQDTTRQKKWLAKVLGDTAKNIKWKIVVGHHPMYTGSNRTEEYDVRATRFSLEPVLKKYKVDAYIAGHDHSLQELVKNNIHYFISGSASEKTVSKLLDISRFAASEYGFMVFAATATQLHMQAIDYNGKILHTSIIQKN